MTSSWKYFLSFIFTMVLAGCSITAPKYTPSIDNVEKLKASGEIGAKVGAFQSAGDAQRTDPISIRGARLVSPYAGGYNAYLSDAITQELSLAGKLKPDSSIEISGTILKNDINAAGIVTASGDIEARFIVTKAGVERYNEIKSIHHEWESSFVGGIAIPRAQNSYPKMVTILLKALYDDPAFLVALK